MSYVIYIRHSESFGNLSNIVDPGMDSTLTINGIKLANKCKENLNFLFDVDLRLSSPTKRAIETSQIIFEDRSFKIESDLQEINFGNDFSIPKNLICYPDYIHKEFSCGESLNSFQSRVVAFHCKLLEQDKNIIAVTHGGFMCMLLHYYNNINLLSYPYFKVSYCDYLFFNNYEYFKISK